ncbi:MAG: PCMD domain-containing protein [Mucinivorans sp.]
MRKFFALCALVVSTFLVGCIDNDIPFPVIAGEVTSIKFEGQKEVKIDAAKRTITLALNDTVDLRAIHILELAITPDSRSTIAAGTVIDFSQASGRYAVSAKPFTFTVATYQEYPWKIICKQDIPYEFVVKDGIDTNIDPRNKAMIVTVPEGTDLSSISVEKFCLGPALATYEPDPSTVTTFTTPQEFKVKYFGIEDRWTIHVQYSKENVITGAVSPWAMFAQVEGKIQMGSDLVASFDYRKASDKEWKHVTANKNNGKITANLTALTPNTDYVFRARLGDESAKEVSFCTLATVPIENMGFEDWALNGTVWYPNAAQENNFWATGNIGVAGAPVNLPSNTQPTNESKKGKAALIKTVATSGVAASIAPLAAGNLFTGDFILNMGTPLNSPKFSRPYTGKPTQLKFWYKYSPRPIDITHRTTPTGVSKGDPDKCIIYVYLGAWTDILLSSQLRKETTTEVIAYGEFTTAKAVDTYTQATIDIHYYDTNRPVSKIIIVATSSIYGDFYTGGSGSTLWLDELEFGWQAPTGK